MIQKYPPDNLICYFYIKHFKFNPKTQKYKTFCRFCCDTNRMPIPFSEILND